MNISPVTLDSALISQAVGLKNDNVQGQIAVAVMKQAMDSQEVVAQALIEMISQPPPRIDGTGSIIDIAA